MIDLRSDTVTKPTKEMRQAAFEAAVGDDVYEEDPTIRELEEVAANMLGKEAAMFVTSGTQGNQIAVLTHCHSGQEIILEADSHIFYYEGAAISAFAGVQPRVVKGENGIMNPVDIQACIREEDVHMPETGLICLENTHNRAGGAIVPLENMKAVYQVAVNHNIPVHLDGARLFNTAIATKTDIKEFAKYTDTVQFCLSKGLGAPVGSIIAGTNEFIKNARKWRKRLGGGLRQGGIIAAPGLVALQTMVSRLAEDHENARLLATGLQKISGFTVENNVDTNIVLLNTKAANLSAEQVLAMMKKEGILAVSFGPETIRLTTHFDVTKEAILMVINKMQAIFL